jgi:hypothetical protein
MREVMSASSTVLESDRTLVASLEDDVRAYRKYGVLSDKIEGLIPKWREQVAHEPARFIRADGSVDIQVLRNFRRLQVFVPDNPIFDSSMFNLKNLLGGGRRGERRMMRECLDIFLKAGDEHLLRTYPCHPAGNPLVFEHRGYRYTHRWLKHIYSLSVFNRVLAPLLEPGFISLDIGSSYGILPSLLKQEHPGSHYVLIDFSEQLILARYFLTTCLPHLKIAGLHELGDLSSISRQELERYDVVLLPCEWYSRLKPGSVDVITNFASLGEMGRQWFEFYMNSDFFQHARFFFTANRVESLPTYDTDLTILDYPIWDPAKRLHFTVSPIFSLFYWYLPRYRFFWERLRAHPYFEYIGRIS